MAEISRVADCNQLHRTNRRVRLTAGLVRTHVLNARMSGSFTDPMREIEFTTAN